MQLNDKVFRFHVRTSGSLQASFVFETAEETDEWIASEFQSLRNKYGDQLKYEVKTLDGLKVGDECHVIGDGDEDYVIEAVIMWSRANYGFVLGPHGFIEHVSKCYAIEGLL